jgi:subtilisin family serine protease
MRKLLILLLVLAATQLSAGPNRYTVIVELQPNANSHAVAAAFGGTIVGSIDGTSIYLLSVPALPVLRSNPALGVQSVQSNDVVRLRPRFGALGVLNTPASGAAEWYAGQPAMKLIRADQAMAYSKGRGVVVADLNSRVDYAHPALIGHLTGGYDFVSGQASEGNSLNDSSSSFLDQSSSGFLDQSTASFLDQSTASFLDQSTASFLDQSTASFLDQSTASFLDSSNPASGHGTFCAALIAAVAPESMIMPLRVFDDWGYADTFSIVRATYYAVRNGAQVINMSFGMTAASPAVEQAIAFATASGVTVVASAGNDNSAAPQYPAAYTDVISAAATDLVDKKAGFSNYGSSIYVTAPGVNIISAYPGGRYAMASGTSFSTALVSGEAALLRSVRWTGTRTAVAKGAINIDSKNPNYAGQLGFGRIDIVRSLESLN